MGKKRKKNETIRLDIKEKKKKKTIFDEARNGWSQRIRQEREKENL